MSKTILGIQEYKWQWSTSRAAGEDPPPVDIARNLKPIGEKGWFRYENWQLAPDEGMGREIFNRRPTKECAVLYCEHDGFSAVPYNPRQNHNDETWFWWGLGFTNEAGNFEIKRNDPPCVGASKIREQMAGWFQIFRNTRNHDHQLPPNHEGVPPRLVGDPAMIWGLAAFHSAPNNIAALPSLVNGIAGQPGVLTCPIHNRPLQTWLVEHGRAFIVQLWEDEPRLEHLELV